MNVNVNFKEVQPIESVVITLSSKENELLMEVLGKLSCSTVAELLGCSYEDARTAYDVTADIYFQVTDIIDPPVFR